MNSDSQNLVKGALVGAAAYLLTVGGKRLYDHFFSTQVSEKQELKTRALRDTCTVSTLAAGGALLFVVFGPKGHTSYFD